MRGAPYTKSIIQNKTPANTNFTPVPLVDFKVENLITFMNKDSGSKATTVHHTMRDENVRPDEEFNGIISQGSPKTGLDMQPALKSNFTYDSIMESFQSHKDRKFSPLDKSPALSPRHQQMFQTLKSHFNATANSSQNGDYYNLKSPNQIYQTLATKLSSLGNSREAYGRPNAHTSIGLSSHNNSSIMKTQNSIYSDGPLKKPLKPSIILRPQTPGYYTKSNASSSRNQQPQVNSSFSTHTRKQSGDSQQRKLSERPQSSAQSKERKGMQTYGIGGVYIPMATRNQDKKIAQGSSIVIDAYKGLQFSRK
ncbi:hypothetical protein FGO68_gene1745 [Halteria grandinella]|uniref:Uncharacterized protein n=1 Tax=Halteria grandinella TaxID=5974 RepID=A0A8J8NV92_HALGN|nr:hypothetical protein FGO68_gene1745 [Halteria grandinella]